MNRPKWVIALAFMFLAASLAHADVSLTVYSSADPAGFDPQRFVGQQRQGYNPDFASQVPGFGVIKDERELEFKAGVNTIGFTDVAAFIDPTTVSFVDLSDADATTVMEQQFLFDLVSPDKLLDKYIDRPITAYLQLGSGQVEQITGTLLANNQGQLVVKTSDGVRMFYRSQAQVQLGELPGGLITKPTLQWLVNSRAAGKRKVRTTYQASGLTWKADYNLVLNAADTRADLGAWVTLINLSGATYPEAQLKLIAGDVQRVQPAQPQRQLMRGRAAMMEADAVGFEEKSFYEYHLYTLPRRTTVTENATQQLALFPTVTDVGIEKILVYDAVPASKYWSFGAPQTGKAFGEQGDKKVDVYLRFENRTENRLGLPLPRGKVRVYKQDQTASGADAGLEFVGEDLIDHTSKNETVMIRTGQAFDVTGSRTQTDFTINTRANVMTESFRIEIANAKDQPVKVIVAERLYRWSQWQIVQQTELHKKIDARTIHFEIEVPAEGKRSVEYTVRYTW